MLQKLHRFLIIIKCLKQEYIRRLDPARGMTVTDLQLVRKGSEPFAFQKAFHGWAKSKFHAQDLSRPVDFLGRVTDTLAPRPVPEGARDRLPPVALDSFNASVALVPSPVATPNAKVCP